MRAYPRGCSPDRSSSAMRAFAPWRSRTCATGSDAGGSSRNRGRGQYVCMVLGEVVDKHGVPGAAVAVVSGDALVATAAVGTANLAIGTPMSPDAACNWFSMTKIATATAAMMLV